MGEYGVYGYSWKEGPPVGVQKYLEGFYRPCIDHTSRQFISKWNSTNAECEFVTVAVASQLVELRGKTT